MVSQTSNSIEGSCEGIEEAILISTHKRRAVNHNIQRGNKMAWKLTQALTPEVRAANAKLNAELKKVIDRSKQTVLDFKPTKAKTATATAVYA